MTGKGVENKDEPIKPDVLIPYGIDKQELSDASVAVIGVRPETNKVSYEAAIIKAAAPFADVVYMANISGRVINEKGIVACHYSSQLQFAINGKEELEKYPELVEAFEKKFHRNFSDAPIIGSYDALLEYRVKKMRTNFSIPWFRLKISSKSMAKPLKK